MTCSPGPRVTGRDSPVSMDSLRLERPSMITPSVGTFSPGFTSTRSPGLSALTGISSTLPSGLSRCASAGRSFTKASSAPEAPMTERISIQWPSSMTSISVASSQKNTAPGSPSTTALE